MIKQQHSNTNTFSMPHTHQTHNTPHTPRTHVLTPHTTHRTHTYTHTHTRTAQPRIPSNSELQEASSLIVLRFMQRGFGGSSTWTSSQAPSSSCFSASSSLSELCSSCGCWKEGHGGVDNSQCSIPSFTRMPATKNKVN